MNKLSIKEAFGSAWKIFSTNVWIFVGSTAFIGAVSFISDKISNDKGLFDFIIGLATAVLLWWLYIGFIRMAMTAHAGGSISFEMLFGEKGTTLWHYIVAVILSAISVLIGLVLLIVPGIMLQIGLMFVPFLILDKNMQPVAALKESWRLTKGYKWKLFGFLCILILVNIAGILAAFVGLLVSIPLSLLVLTYVYRQLEKGVQMEPVASVSTQ
ncbi:hypothetical protein IPJ70_01915 [Candidatus Campbellbacteria bacterium]|nr:MAG: hypothetical protein IPJ70_01915 [Candidatus Campbellbacteria bacterium]